MDRICFYLYQSPPAWLELRELLQDTRVGMASAALLCYPTVLFSQQVPLDIFEQVMRHTIRCHAPLEIRQDCWQCWNQVLLLGTNTNVVVGTTGTRVDLTPQATQEIWNWTTTTTTTTKNELPQHLVVAIQKTLRLLKIRMTQCQIGDNYLHVLIRDGYPSFLIWWVARLFPDLLQTPNARGELPLHVACQQQNVDNTSMTRMQVHLYNDNMDTMDTMEMDHHSLLGQRQDATTTLTRNEWISLLNRSSPIPLLCYLYPAAASQAAGSSTTTTMRGPLALEVFLQRHTVIQQAGRSYHHDQEVLLQDLHCLWRSEPRALDTRNPHDGYWLPFSIPLLTNHDETTICNNGNNDNDDDERLWQQEQQSCFRLTMSYTLLRENPMVLQRYVKA